ncbi:hypothetical protein BO70DRAFT_26929 [Aspergillus heteromorphus CBS 117.55]|uniref:Uncharacterized protein n=1 Tax=Aspergillus heteromorphus CBS 117.55 TaxID=1448321 RepID=A0A317WE29_9EURO|nr:uncharacterized protein BO70DRAFT_26929 [Aspergillus heteromorphus CBS 117.55]PWY83482.1 hypothetical protein BO70DRAFT_26929 [Aspergillus heteromorphus CBS 117.55]
MVYRVESSSFAMVMLHKTEAFVMRYTSKHKTSWIAQRYLAEPHVIQPKIRHMYATRDKTLWWQAISSALSNLRRVVRAHCCRRARLAFRLALKEHGFDGEGRRIGDKTQDLDWRQSGLTGTLDLALKEPIAQMPFDVLQREMNVGVSALVNHKKKMDAGLYKRPTQNAGLDQNSRQIEMSSVLVYDWTARNSRH